MPQLLTDILKTSLVKYIEYLDQLAEDSFVKGQFKLLKKCIDSDLRYLVMTLFVLVDKRHNLQPNIELFKGLHSLILS